MSRSKAANLPTSVRNLPVLLIACLAASPVAIAQQPSCLRVDGNITDSSGAVIAAAQIAGANNQTTTTDAAGHFVLACAVPGTITVQANGFAPGTAQVTPSPNGTLHLDIHLEVAAVEDSVQVNADATTMDTESGPSTTTLSTNEVLQLPDDPDDLLQQLQLLAAAGGGGASGATVVVDGFQNGSTMPPKSSIASIRINPDPISPEYEKPDAEGGGRIEITTKPGSDSYHGALFFTDSDSSFNATDAFSVTATPAGKRRYGFELGGPIASNKSSFALALEKRDIDEFNVVNALTLDANQNQVAEHDTVAAPQRLWIGSARADWMITDKNMVAVSYAARVNDLGNQGIGGLVLPEAGYSGRLAEYDLRLSDTYTINTNMLHETHVGYTWKRTAQIPNSTAPALQVAGYFDGGGATSQNLNNRERDLEVDDDVMMTRGPHSFKFGAQSLGILVHAYDPDTFNGAYVFGGGSAPVLDSSNDPTGATATITPIEQYRRALLNLAGGTPTTYQVTSGNPLVPYTQWRLALYGEDTVKLPHRLMATAGVRYAFQTTPSTFANVGPRLGLAWAPDRDSKWSIHLRAGIFNMPIDSSDAAEAYRLNGARQQQAVVYAPGYGDPLTPIPGSIQVSNMWQFTPAFEQIPVSEFALAIERDLPHHWHPSVWYTEYAAWGDPRTVNINAPLVAASSGAPPDPSAALLAPRPGTPNLNVFEFQNSAHSRGGVLWMGLDQKGAKHWTLSLGYWGVHFHTDSATPQSSYSKVGEAGRADWQSSGALFENDLKFPYKIELSTEAYWHYGAPYNITTGTDDNGDGMFNDRPSFASGAGDGIYATSFGSMTTNVVNGDVPRDLGTMPTIVHAYSNLSRAFNLGSAKDHPRTLTLNARAANLFNHTNVTAVGTVVSSPSLGEGLAAEAARRVELGARFAF
ncbi:MAG TPA: TonB-dependent receptor [Terracidiphilus sp.]|jgi:hypothetical protein|nr:TonB-dependent receptor [Terracidiphilus sp.]